VRTTKSAAETFARLARWCRATARRSELWHSLRAAILLASAFLVLDQFGLTNWLDSLALRMSLVIGGHAVDDRPDTKGISTKSGAEAFVVTIGPAFYESEFYQQSPLDRDRVSSLLAAILSHDPAALVVDVDLSPAGPAGQNSLAQSRLDDLLVGIVTTRHIPVVLSVPFPVATEQAFQTKSHWMQKLCARGVAFGYSEIATTQGVVLDVDPRIPTLPTVAMWATRARQAPKGTADAPCSLLAEGAEAAAFLSINYSFVQAWHPTELAHQVPLRSDLLEHPRRHSHVIATQDDILTMPQLASKVVFVGGTYDPADQFVTAYGQVGGVFVHAASLDVFQGKVARARPLAAVMLDIVIGTIGGIMFAAGWARYASARNRLRGSHETDVRAYVACRLWLVANLASLVFVLAMIMLTSATLLRRGLWSNPAGMLLGAFIHSTMTDKSHGRHVHHGSGERQLWPWPRRIEAIAAALLVLAGVWAMMSG
jgi:hypothetical protein